ncbi:hypothetical protein [Mycobacterium sp. OTB74]|uniref:hypothetical protein n=1 Tax=Mycobacterium sp. OTB74 TaxID=1853452 RepID=UPI002475F379|nr:hypothetical protein [Mycobacterium sp. OTB74]MDH6247998.1 hypothetical protein [Mycobacterium sp. OTB74]
MSSQTLDAMDVGLRGGDMINTVDGSPVGTVYLDVLAADDTGITLRFTVEQALRLAEDLAHATREALMHEALSRRMGTQCPLIAPLSDSPGHRHTQYREALCRTAERNPPVTGSAGVALCDTCVC